MKVRNLLATVYLTTLSTAAVAQPEAGVDPVPSPSVNEPASNAQTPTGAPPPLQSVYMEYMEYKQRVYSTSENISLGDQAKLDMAFQYRFNENTSLRFRFDIDPDKYGDNQNSTSKFELRLWHAYEQFEFQADLDINGDDQGHGGTAVGPDTDSKDSWIAYKPGKNWKIYFRPYNLGTEIGQEFRTLDVARIYYIDGTPSYIANLPVEDESIRSKTVGGLELQWIPTADLKFYAGIGSSSFTYPANEDFNIEQNAASEQWKAKEDRAYKGGMTYKTDLTSIVAEYATHMNAADTGALLDSALSLQLAQWMGPVVTNLEWTVSRAGTQPYRLNKGYSWFQDTTPFRPIYSDYYGVKQDWIGKTDSAELVKVGLKLGSFVPYVAYKHMGQYFISRERESAHRLRTADESASHGGLNRYAIGTYITVGRFTLQPEFEVMQAKNKVFGSASDIREDRILSDLKTKNSVLTLNARYSY